MAAMDFTAIIDSIIRPARSKHNELPLDDAPMKHFIKDKYYDLTAFKVKNSAGNQLSCSFMEPTNDRDRPSELMPCIIYLHMRAANQTEGLFYADQILPLGINFCAFDFSGCGNSEGDQVTLGCKEKDDLKAVISYIKEYSRVSTIGLWGRSMGAATSLLFMKENPGVITCAAMDGGFSSMSDIMGGIFDRMTVEMGYGPGFTACLPILERNFKDRTGFALRDLNPEEAAKSCVAPALFLHGANDEFITPAHTQKLFAAYAGTDKVVKMVNGDHSSERDDAVIKDILDFFKRNFIKSAPDQSETVDVFNVCKTNPYDHNREYQPEKYTEQAYQNMDLVAEDDEDDDDGQAEEGEN